MMSDVDVRDDRAQMFGKWVAAAALVAALVVVPAVLAVLQVVVFHRGQAIGWLGIGPLLASLVLSWRLVAAVSLYTLGVALALVLVHPGDSTMADMVRIAVVSALAAFAVVNCVIRERREARLVQVSEVARVAQRAILKPVPARAGTWSLASRYRSASKGAAVGGDLLEVIPTRSGARAIVGDVCGKGLPAVELAAAVLMAFRDACSRPGSSLVEIARRLDETVLLRAGDESFVTAVLVDFDNDGWLQVVNCGHPPPLRLSASGKLQPLSPTIATCPLGMNPSPASDTYSIAPHDRVLLYTDGLLEARDAEGDFFPLEDQAQLLQAPDLRDALETLLAAMDRHVRGDVSDDVALLLASADLTHSRQPQRPTEGLRVSSPRGPASRAVRAPFECPVPAPHASHNR